MRIALDVHGVIDAKRVFFSELTQLLRRSNEQDGQSHEVHIMTGPRKADCLHELDGIWWTHFYSIVDHHEALGTPMEWVDGRAWMDHYTWDRSKGDYARAQKLDLVFDDSEVYYRFFSTPICIFKAQDNWRVEAARKRHNPKDVVPIPIPH